MILLWIGMGVVGLIILSAMWVHWRDAALRHSGLLPSPGQATMADVERLARAGQSLAAILVYRELHHVGLAEAKKAVDDLLHRGAA